MNELLLLDGATGTELNRRGISTRLPLWSTEALLTDAGLERLGEIHREYVAAGANILTANTFRLHRRNLSRSGCDTQAEELIQLAVEAARQACSSGVRVAGSLAPLEDCYSPELVPSDKLLGQEHAELASRLAAANVDLILVETMNTIREAKAAAQAAEATGLPFFISLVCGSDGRLLSSESVADAACALQIYQPAAILLNCLPADAALKPLQELLSEATDIPAGVYANIGRPHPEMGWQNTDAVKPKAYTAYASTWVKAGARIIGGCCGTTPAHIQMLSHALQR